MSVLSALLDYEQRCGRLPLTREDIDEVVADAERYLVSADSAWSVRYQRAICWMAEKLRAAEHELGDAALDAKINAIISAEAERIHAKAARALPVTLHDEAQIEPADPPVDPTWEDDVCGRLQRAADMTGPVTVNADLVPASALARLPGGATLIESLHDAACDQARMRAVDAANAERVAKLERDHADEVARRAASRATRNGHDS